MFLIVGANGFLGSYLIRTILESTSEEIIAAARSIDNVITDDRIRWIECDITNKEHIEKLSDYCNKHRHLKVFYLAAYHNIDLVKDNPQISLDCNVNALENFLSLSASHIERLIFSSTDCVYGESINDRLFKENDELNPVNLYGQHKILAECIVEKYGFCCARLPFMIGKSVCPSKNNFYDTIVEKLSIGENVNLITGMYRSALDYNTAAKLLLRLIEYSGEIPNIVNVCGDEKLSKYDIGVLIAEYNSLNKSYLVPIDETESSMFFSEKRASCSLMDNTLLRDILKIDGKIKIYF